MGKLTRVFPRYEKHILDKKKAQISFSFDVDVMKRVYTILFGKISDESQHSNKKLVTRLKVPSLLVGLLIVHFFRPG